MHDGVSEVDLPACEVSRPSMDMYRRWDHYMSINPAPPTGIPVLVTKHMLESK